MLTFQMIVFILKLDLCLINAQKFLLNSSKIMLEEFKLSKSKNRFFKIHFKTSFFPKKLFIYSVHVLSYSKFLIQTIMYTQFISFLSKNARFINKFDQHWLALKAKTKLDCLSYNWKTCNMYNISHPKIYNGIKGCQYEE